MGHQAKASLQDTGFGERLQRTSGTDFDSLFLMPSQETDLERPASPSELPSVHPLALFVLTFRRALILTIVEWTQSTRMKYWPNWRKLNGGRHPGWRLRLLPPSLHQ